MTLPIQKKISAFNHNKGNNIRYLVIHDVGTRSTAKNNVDYFSGGNRNASAHYFVDDGSIWQSVEESNSAWHVGDGEGKYGIANSNSIGIEMCLPNSTVTAKTEQNTIELVRDLMKKYGIPLDRVVRHYDASRKNCPAQFNLDKKWTRWHQFKAKLSGSAPAPVPAPPKKKRGDIMLLFRPHTSPSVYWLIGNRYRGVKNEKDLKWIKDLMNQAGYDTHIHTDPTQIEYIRAMCDQIPEKK